MSLDKIPYLVRHCVVAIYLNGGLHESDKKRAQSAWNIALAQLTKYGYLRSGSEKGDPDKIRLTSKGTLRENKHRREGSWKNKYFLHLFTDISEAIPKKGDVAKGLPNTAKEHAVATTAKK
jgi:hypothetical protein